MKFKIVCIAHEDHVCVVNSRNFSSDKESIKCANDYYYPDIYSRNVNYETNTFLYEPIEPLGFPRVTSSESSFSDAHK